MAWWAIPLATSILGARNAQRKADQQERYNKGQAEVTRYSPWTGLQAQMDNSYAPGMIEGGLSGGLSGMAFSQGLQGMQGPQANPMKQGMDPQQSGFYDQMMMNQQQGQMMPAQQQGLYNSPWGSLGRS